MTFLYRVYVQTDIRIVLPDPVNREDVSLPRVRSYKWQKRGPTPYNEYKL